MTTNKNYAAWSGNILCICGLAFSIYFGSQVNHEHSQNTVPTTVSSATSAPSGGINHEISTKDTISGKPYTGFFKSNDNYSMISPILYARKASRRMGRALAKPIDHNTTLDPTTS